jgi:hypothetical protein
MLKFVIPGVLALALTGAGTMAIAQTQTQTQAGGETTTQSQGGTMKQGKTAMPASEKQVITAAQAEAWVGKRVYTDDDSDIGEIAAFKAGDDGNVMYFHTDIGGFLGIGETSVQVTPAQLEMRGDKIYLMVSKEEAMKLPRVEN